MSVFYSFSLNIDQYHTGFSGRRRHTGHLGPVADSQPNLAVEYKKTGRQCCPRPSMPRTPRSPWSYSHLFSQMRYLLGATPPWCSHIPLAVVGPEILVVPGLQTAELQGHTWYVWQYQGFEWGRCLTTELLLPTLNNSTCWGSLRIWLSDASKIFLFKIQTFPSHWEFYEMSTEYTIYIHHKCTVIHFKAQRHLMCLSFSFRKEGWHNTRY